MNESTSPSVIAESDERAAWFALAMNAAADLEDAANCLRDSDAKAAALGAAKHVRISCNALWDAQTKAVTPQPGRISPEHLAQEAWLSHGYGVGTTQSSMFFHGARYAERLLTAPANTKPVARVVTILQGRNAGKQVQMLVDLPNGTELFAASHRAGAKS